MAIAALVVWLLTAAAGLTLLISGSMARRRSARAPAPAPAQVPVPGAGRGPDGAMPDIPRVKVHAPPDEHPLLEFSHPTLGLLGVGLWFVYVGTHRQPLAWVAFGVLLLTIAAGLSWRLRSAWSARAAGRPGQVLPTGVSLLHGLLATATFVLAVLTALVASHG